jgi:hypothetical protein
METQKKYRGKRAVATVMAMVLLLSFLSFSPVAGRSPSLVYESENGVLVYLGHFDTGAFNAGGGVAEVVAFNPGNNSMYVISGSLVAPDGGTAPAMDIIYLGGLDANGQNVFMYYHDTVTRIFFTEMGEEHGFDAYDVTSVSINTRLQVVAVAVQAEAHDANGYIVFLDYDGNYLVHFSAGVQPDMIGFSPCNNYVMTANEGEPWYGWLDEIDPPGSVTLIDLSGVSNHAQLLGLSANSVYTVGFEAFDTPQARAQLIENGVLLRVGAMPSLDLEPEFIAFAADGRTAFVSLQEANAIATFDIPTRSFTDIRGLGFTDHSVVPIALNNSADMRTVMSTHDNIFGIRMPDGIAAIEINGVQYVLTANEGDAREFPEGDNGNPNHNYSRIGSGSRNWAHHSRNFSEERIEYLESNFPDLEFIQNDFHYVLNERTDDLFILGGRSFSIFRASDMSLVFDSGSEFEEITMRAFPTIFNADRGGNGSRNHRKGPEPEDVQVMTIGDRHFAFIGLERMGGILMYDITQPANAFYVDYLNVRCIAVGGQESKDNGSHLGAEVLTTVSAQDSPIGIPLVLVANETSGTVTIIKINLPSEQPQIPTRYVNGVAFVQLRLAVDAHNASVAWNSQTQTITVTTQGGSTVNFAVGYRNSFLDAGRVFITEQHASEIFN